MTQPASALLGIARLILMTRRAKVLVLALNSMGFMHRNYKRNRQSAIGNRQFGNEVRVSQFALAAAGGSAGAGAVFLLVRTRTAEIADAVHRSQIAFFADHRHFADTAENPICACSSGGGALGHCAGAAAIRI